MSISRTAAAVGGLVLLAATTGAAQDAVPRRAPVGQFAATGGGSVYGAIYGTVQDEWGVPLNGAVVSALGVTNTFVVTDKAGRFEFRTLSTGAYLVRAHLTGFIAPSGETIEVRPGGRTSSSIALRRASALAGPSAAPAPAPILTAGVGATPPIDSSQRPDPAPPDEPVTSDAGRDDNHSELAWRLRHLRRSVLQDVDLPVTLLAEEPSGADSIFGAPAAFGRSVGTSARVAASLLAGAPLSGELNFLTTSSFDSPQQLFGSDTMARNVAYMSVGSPTGSRADWAVRGALSQADISSWVLAGTYSTYGPAGHHYDVGLSYATQRYDGGNPAALRNVTDGSRNAGAVYGFDTYTLSPAIALSYGARYARYYYLGNKGLVSPRVSLTLSPGEHFRISSVASRRTIAPGAEEFLPPGESGIWLPPQRTFSSLTAYRQLEGEATTHFAVEIERELAGASLVSIGAFRQYVADQLVTMFGLDLPGQPAASVGHYFVGDFGDVDARGLTAAFRTGVADRVQGSVEYTMTRADWSGGNDLGWMLRRLPSATPLRPNRIHGVSTSLVANVPETSTHVIVLYQVSRAAGQGRRLDNPMLDSRFDVQVRQSLPFLDFSTAKWEMLVGVRNFFRESAADQSVFDELLVVRPPKRIVGGLTMRF